MASTSIRLLGGEIIVETGSLWKASGYIEKLDPYTIHLLYDRNVEEWADKLAGSISSKVHLIPLNGGESVKDLKVAEHIWMKLLEAGATRDSVVIAMGGGSLLDVAGFAASTYMRGCKLVYVPTTLLAQADAAVGGKTGINFKGKNVIGTFRIPDLVIVDPSVLRSLPDDSYIDGMAEVVKHAIIGGWWFVDLLLDSVDDILSRNLDVVEKIVYSSVRVKASIVEKDPLEKWDRMILNYGHTIGHALEKASNYGITHGRAVSIGMMIEGLIATKLTGFPEEELDIQEELLDKFGLPKRLERGIVAGNLVDYMKIDKKFRRGKPKLPLPITIGSFKIIDVGWDQLWGMLETLRA